MMLPALVLHRAAPEHADGLVVELDRHLGLLVAQLADVPVGVEQDRFTTRTSLRKLLDLLQVPEREGVVVAVGEHERAVGASGASML